jgi:hypothetical protein
MPILKELLNKVQKEFAKSDLGQALKTEYGEIVEEYSIGKILRTDLDREKFEEFLKSRKKGGKNRQTKP